MCSLSVVFLFPAITNIVNFSPTSGQFHPILNKLITPLLKKSTLDKDELFNYRPIFNYNLFVISRIIKRDVKSRLIDYFISNKLLNPHHQSAYYGKHHSTETALLYINFVLYSFKSYLSSRSFRVKCDNNQSSFYRLPLVVFPKALFLAFYSSLCTLPLSVL